MGAVAGIAEGGASGIWVEMREIIASGSSARWEAGGRCSMSSDVHDGAAAASIGVPGSGFPVGWRLP